MIGKTKIKNLLSATKSQGIRVSFDEEIIFTTPTKDLQQRKQHR
jgi:hypothetical protein